MKKAKTGITIIMALIITLSCMIGVNVNAKNTDLSSEIDSSTGKVTIIGSIPNINAKYVILTVLNPNAANGMNDIYDSMSEEEFLSKVYNIVQIRLDNSNTFRYEFTMSESAEQGWYTVSLSGNGISGISALQDRFFYVNENKIRRNVEELNSASIDEFDTLLLDIGVVLGDDYSKVTADTYSNFIKINSELGGFDSTGNIDEIVNEVRSVFNQAKALALLNSAKVSSVNTILETYSKYLDLDLTGDYTKINGKIGEVFVAVRDDLKININSKPSLLKVYEPSLALAVLNTSDRTAIHDVLVKYNHILKLNLDGNYKKVEKLDVAKALAFSNFLSIEKVADAFNKAVSELYKKTTSGSTGGGGGGSSGGSNGGTNYTVTKDTVAPPVENIPKPANNNVFDDLDTVEWAKESIIDFAKRGVVNGVDGKNFLPNKTVTREEFVKIMVMALGLDNTQVIQANPFSDVDESGWYYKYILISNQIGIVKGMSEDSFGIGNSLTRQDLAVICYRAAKAKGVDIANAPTANIFGDDANIDDYAKEAVYALYAKGIISGVGDNSFSPKTIATRAQAVKIMYEITKFSE